MTTTDLMSRARAGEGAAFQELTEPHRRELLLHCYRMLGSFQEQTEAISLAFVPRCRCCQRVVRVPDRIAPRFQAHLVGGSRLSLQRPRFQLSPQGRGPAVATRKPDRRKRFRLLVPLTQKALPDADTR